MTAPPGVLWDFKPHTGAKHQLLQSYLDAWFSIMGQRDFDLVVVDGFCGPGEYLDGQPGSPQIIIDRYLRAKEALGTKWNSRVRFWFIDEDRRRIKHLLGLGPVVKLGPLATVRAGRFSDEFPPLLREARTTMGQRRAMFAFVDPFGADTEATQIAAEITALPSSEVLLYVPTGYVHRFVSTPEFRGKLQTLGHGIDWDDIEAVPMDERRAAIRDAFARVLPCRWVRWFEVTPAVGGNTYTMIFGTNNRRGLQRMKDAMWQVDPAGGASFKDTTAAQAPTLFGPTPDYSALRRLIRARFRTDPFTVKQALDFVLFETPFRDNAHLKRHVLKAAETDGTLLAVGAPAHRRAGTYKDEGLLLRFAS